MVAGTRAQPNEDAIAPDEARPNPAPKPEPDGKLEDAVQRAMNDLEQERRGSSDAGRARPSAP
jgi:hypothetical protein